jgi:hypothetical protein
MVTTHLICTLKRFFVQDLVLQLPTFLAKLSEAKMLRLKATFAF